MNTKKLKNKILLCLILIVVGISLLLNDYVVAKREKVFSATNLELTELLKEENYLDRQKAISLQHEIDTLTKELEELNILWEEKMTLI